MKHFALGNITGKSANANTKTPITMPTKTPREIELEEKIYELSRLIETSAEGWHTFNHDVYLPALKTLLEEARQETKEKCAKKAFDFADNLEKKTGVDASYARAVGNLILSL